MVVTLARGTDPLGHVRRGRRNAVLVALMLLGLVVTVLVTTALGPVFVAPETVGRILAFKLFAVGEVSWDATAEGIVWAGRFPRVLLAVAVGAGLAVCGMALQAMVRNMLADPYLLGINSGASTGAALSILFGIGLGFGEYALTGSAFLGALGASLLVFFVARAAGRITSVRLLLAGVAVGYALSALTSFLIFMSGSAEGSRSVMFWLLGSLTLASWGVPLFLVLGVVVLTLGVLTAWGTRLDALAIGDETAHILGISATRFRTQLLVLVSLCVGVVVAASGSIGFVGLVVPHLARRLAGAVHAWSLPVAALMGGTFLAWADLLARTVLQPRELPIGIITALVGAPFLLYLIRSLYRTGA